MLILRPLIGANDIGRRWNRWRSAVGAAVVTRRWHGRSCLNQVPPLICRPMCVARDVGLPGLGRMSCWPVSFALVSKAEGGVTEFMKRDLGGRKFDDTATGPP